MKKRQNKNILYTNYLGVAVALGAALGASIGNITGNLPTWTSIGAGIGVFIGLLVNHLIRRNIHINDRKLNFKFLSGYGLVLVVLGIVFMLASKELVIPGIVTIMIGYLFIFEVSRFFDKSPKKDKKAVNHLLHGIALGSALGVVIGIALGNIAIGLSVGMSVGVAIGTTLEAQHG